MLGNYTFPDGRSDRDYNATQTQLGAGAVLGKMQIHLHDVLNIWPVTGCHWRPPNLSLATIVKYLQPTWGDHAVISRLFWEQDNRQRKVKINLSHTQILLNTEYQTFNARASSGATNWTTDRPTAVNHTIFALHEVLWCDESTLVSNIKFAWNLN